MKKKGYNGHTGLERGKPCKKFGWKRQKMEDCACPNRREKKEFEKVLKKWFQQVKSNFLKTWLTIFDWLKISFDWLKQKKTHHYFWAQFQLIEKQARSIEILEKTEFLKKINRFLKKLLKALNIRNKMHEYKMKCFSKTQVLNSVFPKLRFSNILPLNS